MRNELEKIITHWMEQDASVLFLAADIGGGLYKKLAERFPRRVTNVGIAEQNMIGMAAGLTDMGFRVICYSKACFISLRVADQIKNALCYAQKNVLLIGADAGYDEANAGHPHIALEDLGIAQSFPGMDIYMPTTFHGLHNIFSVLRDSDRPSYLRINKGKLEESGREFRDVGFALYYLKETGRAQTLAISYGCAVIEAMRIAEKNPGTNVLAMDSFSIDDDALLEEVRRYERMLVVEEQFERNGLYDYLCRWMVRHYVTDIALERMGPEFSYRKHCFDRETALAEERKRYGDKYDGNEGSETADGTDAASGQDSYGHAAIHAN